MRAGTCLAALLFALLPGMLRSQEPQMATKVIAVRLELEACKTHVQQALRGLGYTDLLSFGNGWIGHVRRTSASVGCLPGTGESSIFIVTAGGLHVSELKRLMDRLAIQSPAGLSARVDSAPSVGSGWEATAAQLRGILGQRYNFWCPPNGRPFPVFGTDVYTAGSSVCSAAVHAGHLTFAGGGNAIIELRSGQSAYTGSERNGVASQSAAAATLSFALVGKP